MKAIGPASGEVPAGFFDLLDVGAPEDDIPEGFQINFSAR